MLLRPQVAANLFSLLCRMDKTTPLVNKGQPRGPGNGFIWDGLCFCLVHGGRVGGVSSLVRLPWAGPAVRPAAEPLGPADGGGAAQGLLGI